MRRALRLSAGSTGHPNSAHGAAGGGSTLTTELAQGIEGEGASGHASCVAMWPIVHGIAPLTQLPVTSSYSHTAVGRRRKWGAQTREARHCVRLAEASLHLKSTRKPMHAFECAAVISRAFVADAPVTTISSGPRMRMSSKR